MVGVNSEITATIANLGVRNMTDSEGTKLEVTFYTSSPFTSKLATINVDKALQESGLRITIGPWISNDDINSVSNIIDESLQSLELKKQ